MQYCTDIVML